MSRPRKTANEMFPLIEAYRKSPLTQKAFCQQHALSVAVLNYWIKRYREHHMDTHPAKGFVEITPMNLERTLVEVIYPHGVRLRLFQPPEASTLAQLVHLA